MGWQRMIALGLVPLAFGSVDACADKYVQMHEKGEALPFKYQGPFVTRGDGAVLAVDKRHALVSRDDGKTWAKHALFADAAKFVARPERALIRTREGVVVFAFLNEVEKRYDKKGDSRDWFLPTYVTRSTDDGETWAAPQQIQDGWCGAVRGMIQLKSGRLVLPGQRCLPDPTRHVVLTYVSDDDGQTWRKSNVVGLGGKGSHGGAMESTVIELADGRLYMLIRTSQPWGGRVWFWEAFSADGGLTWTDIRNSGILASTCCGTLARLSDGRITLLWNRPEEGKPYDRNTRAELAMAFSTDECRSWTRPVVVSRRPLQPGEKYYMARQSYPYAYERRPGELWLTTMQGELRMRLRTADVAAAPDPDHTVRPLTVVALGSSTTARRGGIDKVYEQRLAEIFPDWRFINAGVGGDTTVRARQRFTLDVLKHRPDVVIIQLGANDAAIDVWRGATEPRVAPAKYEENLRFFVRTLKAQNAQPILMTAGMFRWTPKLLELYGKPPYDPKDPNGFNLKLAEYAPIVRRIAQEESVPLVDVFEAHEAVDRAPDRSVDDLLLDGMHPNDTGHKLVTDLLVPVLEGLFKRER